MCDLGVGIYQSYVRAGLDEGRFEAEIVEASFQEGVSSRNIPGRGPWRGVGLFEAREFIVSVRGKMTVETGKTASEAHLEPIQSRVLPHSIDGTIIKIEVPRI